MGIWSGRIFVQNYRHMTTAAVFLALGVEAVALAGLSDSFEIDGDQASEVNNIIPVLDWKGIDFAVLKQSLDCAHLGTTAGCPGGGKDDAFKGGVKEADKVSFASPGIPPKDDLTRFLVHSQVAAFGNAQNVLLHLAFERQAPSTQNGDANIDIEINKNAAENGVLPSRSPGDFLVAFNYSSGGDAITIYLLEWITPENVAEDCAITGNDSPPNCWGHCVRILAEDPSEPLEPNCSALALGPNEDPVAIADVNTTALPAGSTAPYTSKGDSVQLQPLQFGEMSINLTAADIVQGCETFSSGYIKSRASTSINSQLKDIIRPMGVNISFCKTIRIVKTDDENPGHRLAGAEFAIYENDDDVCDDSDLDNKLAGTCSTGKDGECSVTGLLPGNYCVYESKAPDGYGFATSRMAPVDATGNGPSFEVTFVDPRLYKVIVLVCREDLDELHESSYTLDKTYQTLASGQLDVADADLCALPGDLTYKQGQTNKNLTVKID